MSEQATEIRADLPAFTFHGVVFEPWVIGTGGAARYVWRDAARRIAVGTRLLERPETETVKKGDKLVEVIVHQRARGWWARVDGALIGSEYATAVDAMFYAARRIGDQRSAPARLSEATDRSAPARLGESKGSAAA